MDLSQTFRETHLRRIHASFHNKHLENGTYLSPAHRDELIAQSEIVSWDEYKDPTIVPGVGTIRHIGFVTHQGYEYAVSVGEPENPGSALNIPIIGTTAWYTGLDGFNDVSQRRFMRDGNYVIRVGAEGSFRSRDSDRLHPSSPISQANSAAAVLGFVELYVDELIAEGHSIDPVNRIVEGASRGGNVGIGITALAPNFQQNVIALEALAPRLPDRLEVRSTPHLLRQLGSESVKLTMLPLALGLQHLPQYANSADLRSPACRYHGEIGGAIMNGEAGQLIAGFQPEQYADFVLLSKDGSHEHASWEQKLWPYRAVRTHHVDGIHMDIPVRRVQDPIRRRTRSIRECAAALIPITAENVDAMMLEFPISPRKLGRRALSSVG